MGEGNGESFQAARSGQASLVSVVANREPASNKVGGKAWHSKLSSGLYTCALARVDPCPQTYLHTNMMQTYQQGFQMGKMFNFPHKNRIQIKATHWNTVSHPKGWQSAIGRQSIIAQHTLLVRLWETNTFIHFWQHLACSMNDVFIIFSFHTKYALRTQI